MSPTFTAQTLKHAGSCSVTTQLTLIVQTQSFLKQLNMTEEMLLMWSCNLTLRVKQNTTCMYLYIGLPAAPYEYTE